MKAMQKIRRGASFGGCVAYCMKGGELIGGTVAGATLNEITTEFNLMSGLRPGCAKPVWHQSLRLPAGEKLDNSRWLETADKYMSEMGFTDKHQYAIFLHDDLLGQHIHIVANRVGADSKLFLGRNENFESTRIVAQLEKDLGLTKTKTAEYKPVSDFEKAAKAANRARRDKLWNAQLAAERERKARIKTAYEYEKNRVRDNRALSRAEQAAALSIARMQKIEAEIQLKAVIGAEREALNIELKKPVVPGIEAKNERPAEPVLPRAHPSYTHTIDSQGVTYSKNGVPALRDTPKRVDILKPTEETIADALRLGQLKYGADIQINGDAQFFELACRVAAAQNLKITLYDAAGTVLLDNTKPAPALKQDVIETAAKDAPRPPETPTADAEVIRPDVKRLTPGETEKAVRTGVAPLRSEIAAAIDAALETQCTASQFVERLEAAGLQVRPALATTGRLNGFSIGRNGVFFKGSQLGDKYKLQQLEKRGFSYDKERDCAALASSAARCDAAASTNSEPVTEPGQRLGSEIGPSSDSERNEPARASEPVSRAVGTAGAVDGETVSNAGNERHETRKNTATDYTKKPASEERQKDTGPVANDAKKTDQHRGETRKNRVLRGWRSGIDDSAYARLLTFKVNKNESLPVSRERIPNVQPETLPAPEKLQDVHQDIEINDQRPPEKTPEYVHVNGVNVHVPAGFEGDVDDLDASDAVVQEAVKHLEATTASASASSPDGHALDQRYDFFVEMHAEQGHDLGPETCEIAFSEACTSLIDDSGFTENRLADAIAASAAFKNAFDLDDEADPESEFSMSDSYGEMCKKLAEKAAKESAKYTEQLAKQPGNKRTAGMPGRKGPGM